MIINDSIVNVIYSHSRDNRYRYSLGTKGENTLFCFGINPSTATPDNYDPTLRKVRNVAQRQGFDSFVMFNIYPFRATNPDDLPANMEKKEHENNIRIILDTIQDGSVIWAAWGNLINSRAWLADCRNELITKMQKSKKSIKWVKMGDLTVRNNPRHPLYLRYQDFSECCI